MYSFVVFLPSWFNKACTAGAFLAVFGQKKNYDVSLQPHPLWSVYMMCIRKDYEKLQNMQI
jgi:hypothetical protein